jgi:solute carrier family 35 protein F1/2
MSLIVLFTSLSSQLTAICLLRFFRSAPTFTVGLFYFGLAFLLIIPATRKNTESPHKFLWVIPLQAPALTYLPMAVLDVYANYATVLAFKYTTITSVTLFDALAIPSSMIISKCFLHKRYSTFHLLGVLSCSVGILFNFYHDYKHMDNDQTYPHKLWGDVLAVTGGILYGADNVVGEVAVRRLGGPTEYLGMLGFYAFIICLVQSLLLEREEIAEFFGGGDKSETCSEGTAWWLLFAYFSSSILGYIGGARFLVISEATFFSLSLLTSDIWSVLFSIFAEHISPGPLFYVALVWTVSGVILYEMAPTPVAEDRGEPDEYNSSNNEVDDSRVELQPAIDHRDLQLDERMN